METPRPSKKHTLLPFFTGLVLALLLCGIPVILFVSSGRFREITKPFAYAAQTAAAPIAATQVEITEPGTLATSTADISGLPYSRRFDMAGDDISEALNHLFNGEYAEEILAWDKVLEVIPEYAEAHYNRGQAYLKLSNTQRSQQEYLFYLSKAGEDFDTAIDLAPYSKGDYYFGRFEYFNALAGNQATRVDYMNLEQTALDNLLTANRLGNYIENSETRLALVYIAVGKCEEGIEQANRLIAGTTDPTADMLGALSIGYFCKNDLPNALKYMNEVVSRVDGCTSRFDRARIYYAMGKLEEALADLDFTIAKSPNYCGVRYYLRGLIYAEKGELEKAENDLAFGIGQTWQRGGLLSYGQAKVALAQGNTEAAIQYLQEAESTYTLYDPIYTKIQEDLNALGASPLELVTSFEAATSIPLPTPFLTPRPTSSPNPSLPTPVFTEDPNLQYATIIDLEKPIEPVKIGWGFSAVWHFQPAKPLDHREVQRLSVWLVSSDTTQRLPRQISLWNFRSNMWGGNNELHWGENRIDRANEFVSPDGDVYIQFANDSETLETIIDTFGITLVLQRTDGSVEVHGITP